MKSSVEQPIVVCSPSPTYADLESRILALEQQLAIRSPKEKP